MKLSTYKKKKIIDMIEKLSIEDFKYIERIIKTSQPDYVSKLTKQEIKERDCPKHNFEWDGVSPPWEQDDKCTLCGKMNYSGW